MKKIKPKKFTIKQLLDKIEELEFHLKTAQEVASKYAYKLAYIRRHDPKWKDI